MAIHQDIQTVDKEGY